MCTINAGWPFFKMIHNLHIPRTASCALHCIKQEQHWKRVWWALCVVFSYFSSFEVEGNNCLTAEIWMKNKHKAVSEKKRRLNYGKEKGIPSFRFCWRFLLCLKTLFTCISWTGTNISRSYVLLLKEKENKLLCSFYRRAFFGCSDKWHFHMILYSFLGDSLAKPEQLLICSSEAKHERRKRKVFASLNGNNFHYPKQNAYLAAVLIGCCSARLVCPSVSVGER